MSEYAPLSWSAVTSAMCVAQAFGAMCARTDPEPSGTAYDGRHEHPPPAAPSTHLADCK